MRRRDGAGVGGIRGIALIEHLLRQVAAVLVLDARNNINIYKNI